MQLAISSAGASDIKALHNASMDAPGPPHPPKTTMRRTAFKYMLVWLGLLSVLALCTSSSAAPQEVEIAGRSSSSVGSELGGFPDLYEASIAELQEGLEKRRFTSVDLVKVSARCLSGAESEAELYVTGVFCEN